MFQSPQWDVNGFQWVPGPQHNDLCSTNGRGACKLSNHEGKKKIGRVGTHAGFLQEQNSPLKNKSSTVWARH